MKGLQVTKKVRSYEKKVRNGVRKTLVTKLPSYEIVTPHIGVIYHDV